eukprot:gene18814-6198_t
MTKLGQLKPASKLRFGSNFRGREPDGSRKKRTPTDRWILDLGEMVQAQTRLQSARSFSRESKTSHLQVERDIISFLSTMDAKKICTEASVT